MFSSIVLRSQVDCRQDNCLFAVKKQKPKYISYFTFPLTMKTETSLSFRNEDEQRKVACFTVLVCCLPSEECHFTWESDSKKVSYNHKILSYIANDWNIPTPYFETYRNLFAVLNSNDASEIDRKDILSAFIGVLIQMKTDLTDVLIRICIYLISNRFYSSRGRRLLRNLSVSFQLPYKDFIALEICISSVLKNYEDFIKKSTKKEKVHDIKRYAKIGAVSIGAGALLALTGGMAAPAIAAALLAVGGTTALTLATFSSVTIIASLLGSAGAGLAGYKMVMCNFLNIISYSIFVSATSIMSLVLLICDNYFLSCIEIWCRNVALQDYKNLNLNYLTKRSILEAIERYWYYFNAVFMYSIYVNVSYNGLYTL